MRYPGGKAKLFARFAELIAFNSLFGVEYVEPYAGGAGLAIRLLTTGYVNSIRLNDVDAAIHAFWLSALFNSEEFCALIDAAPATVEEWKRQRTIYQDQDASDPLKLGFAAFYLNRTSRSGIIEGSGPIGGYGQAGPWRLDLRLNRQALIKNIQLLSMFKDRIELSNIDACQFIRKLPPSRSRLIYLDPPYFDKGQRLYKNYYSSDDHVLIADMVKNELRDPWLVSYDDVAEIIDLYKPHEPIRFTLPYSAARKRRGSEVMFMSSGLDRPVSWQEADPANPRGVLPEPKPAILNF